MQREIKTIMTTETIEIDGVGYPFVVLNQSIDYNVSSFGLQTTGRVLRSPKPMPKMKFFDISEITK